MSHLTTQDDCKCYIRLKHTTHSLYVKFGHNHSCTFFKNMPTIWAWIMPAWSDRKRSNKCVLKKLSQSLIQDDRKCYIRLKHIIGNSYVKLGYNQSCLFFKISLTVWALLYPHVQIESRLHKIFLKKHIKLWFIIGLNIILSLSMQKTYYKIIWVMLLVINTL